MVREKFDRSVDGVISVDPIALSYVLRGTGPLKLSDGKVLTSRNAVKLLLNEVYVTYDRSPRKQDAYFADAARRVFAAVAAGKGDQRTILAGFADAVDENRIFINSTHEDEQQVLAQTRIAGALMRDASSTPHVGIFLNDSTTTKLEYYLEKQDPSQLSRVRRGRHADVDDGDRPALERAERCVDTAKVDPRSGHRRETRLDQNEPAFVRTRRRLGHEIRVNEQERTVNRGSDGERPSPSFRSCSPPARRSLSPAPSRPARVREPTRCSPPLRESSKR